MSLNGLKLRFTAPLNSHYTLLTVVTHAIVANASVMFININLIKFYQTLALCILILFYIYLFSFSFRFKTHLTL